MSLCIDRVGQPFRLQTGTSFADNLILIYLFSAGQLVSRLAIIQEGRACYCLADDRWL